MCSGFLYERAVQGAKADCALNSQSGSVAPQDDLGAVGIHFRFTQQLQFNPAFRRQRISRQAV